MNYAGREVYPDSPLQLVVAEAKFPHCLSFKSEEAQDSVQRALADDLPLRGGAEPSGPEGNFRLHDVARTCALTITPTMLTLETTLYRDFGAFESLFVKAWRALPYSEVRSIDRIGIRYLDEIRAPEPISSLQDWRRWLNPELVTGNPIAVPPVDYQAALSYQIDNGQRLTLRLGTLDGQGIVLDGSVLRRVKPTQSGPFAFIDIDSYWEVSDAGTGMAADPANIGGMLKKLHAPAGELFQSTITEEFKQHLRGMTPQ